MYRTVESCLHFLPSSVFPSSPLPPLRSVVRLTRLTSRLRSTVHRVASPVTSHLPPLPSPPPQLLCREASGDLEGAGNSIRFTRPEMVTGPKLSDQREKGPLTAFGRCFFSCYARNVNACWAFRETCRRGCFFFLDVLRP